MIEAVGHRRWLLARGWCLAVTTALALTMPTVPVRAAANEVFIEALTSPELAARVAAGATTILLPIGGTEQNGPHMVLGKHNRRVQLLAGRIAQQLGQTLVAPVLAYVPEGSIDPPAAHMRFAGTISIGEPAFEALLESAARSFRRHGFTEVVLLADHGGYRASVKRVAEQINREWARSPCRVHAMPEYYRAAAEDFAKDLAAKGYSAAEIGSHAGLADTSLTLAVAPTLVRSELLATNGRGHDGVSGDPRRASAELGRAGIAHIVQTTVAAIRAATASITPHDKPR